MQLLTSASLKLLLRHLSGLADCMADIMDCGVAALLSMATAPEYSRAARQRHMMGTCADQLGLRGCIGAVGS